MSRHVRVSTGWFVCLALAIALVEFGFREPRGVQAELPSVGLLAPWIDRVRLAPFALIDDPVRAAVVSGIVLGRTDGIPHDLRQAFLDAGLWHLLAASGQNVALVVGVCLLAARVLRQSRTAGVVIALIAVPAYVLLVGGGASIVRAGIMGELVLVAWLSGRLAHVGQLILVAATVLCWIWPGVHRSLGFQLSFACVVALWLAGEPLTRSLVQRGVPRWLAGLGGASLICALATGPILALRVGGAPFTSTVANLVAIPLAALVLVLGLGGVIATSVGLVSVGHVLIAPAQVIAGVLVVVAHRAASLPYAQVGDRSLLVGVPLCAGIAYAARRVDAGRVACALRRLAWSGMVACGLWWLLVQALSATGAAVPLTGSVPARARGQVRIAVLDVGQGDAAAIATDDGALLIDVGPPGGEVVRRARAAGIRRVEGIVLTHDSLDHRGSIDEAVAAFRPRWVARPRHGPGPWARILARAPQRVIDLCDGDELRLGAVSIEVRNPPCDGRVTPRTGDIHNDGALVLLVRHRRMSAVIPGDAEAPVLRRLALPSFDVLRVSHHGSDDPELPTLLDQVRPRVAVISVGRGNSYGHPRASTLRALSRAGARTLRTDRDGSVILDSDGVSMTRR